MKKYKKRIVGCLGLFLVAGITIFAASMPGQEAKANTSSVTDTIIVRVVGNTPNININGSDKKNTYVEPAQTITYDYEHVKKITITIKHTDKDGVETITTLDEFDVTDDFGSGSLNLNLEDYGYGDFIVTIVGTGLNNVSDEDFIEFSYYPLTATAKENDSADVDVDIDYDTDNDEINTIEIEVFDENGNPIPDFPIITVTPPDQIATLPFNEHELPSGKYIIKITAYDENGNPLYLPYEIIINYTAKEDEIIVPDTADTGGLFNGLNISKSDYLATGLIIFFLVGIFGIIIIGKNRQDKKRH